MNQFYFKRVIEKIQYNFIPVYNVKDNSLLGYKIIKDFNPVGFNDKDLMYQMAYEKGIFEEFILELLHKAYKMAIEKNLTDCFLFYTLRMNFVSSEREFFTKINNMVKKLNLKSENLIFDIKYINNWSSFYEKIEDIYHYKIILKENRGERINITAIRDSKTALLEFRTIEHLKNLRSDIPRDIKLIFDLAYDDSITVDDLKNLDVDYYYKY
ncbi:hypothetical protein IX317_002201 [Fusobacterium sp. DD29]|uniref:hypothetical protein n=1 Tax=unclassified Fusobacterium TaxID=2648384 RepID=UPI001B8B0C65|nr:MULTISPECIES: hypothetical protein [unclassified Fusobacterium]MBR8702262.1 hypothetical protein [Fusobacterium sp. DD45]MBR8712079.1 hypothetical protein [Fusobacterium sp. DD28]MBR8750479.1 hypothetical protein [Fusobacterium sp. DD29]MBR8752656.1 hypothetical protein [Fusobacterium sp. DD26]MBR8762718.1 hypothetical protein [Fusobacterium sp. DD25]